MQQTITKQICLNCGEDLQGDFCHGCGQPAHTGRITFRETLASYLSAALLIEGKYFITIKRLITNPGRLFREYLAGKRATYYKPIAFFILNTAIYILIRALIDYDPLEGRFNNTDSSEVPAAFRKMRQAARFMVNNINYILFTLVFAIALWFKAFYRKRHYLAEYTVIGFFIAGAYILIGTAAMLMSKFFNLDISTFQLIMLGGLIFYGAVSFIRPVSVASVFKSLLISILSVVFYLLFSFGLSLLIVSWIS